MVEMTTDEDIWTIDEERKVLIGQKTTVQEFDAIEIEQQIKLREDMIKAGNEGIEKIQKELDAINKYKQYFPKWKKEYIEEQKKGVEKLNKELKEVQAKKKAKTSP